MGAATQYFVKVPLISYHWVETYAVTADEAREKYPDAVDVKHWVEFEEFNDSYNKYNEGV